MATTYEDIYAKQKPVDMSWSSLNIDFKHPDTHLISDFKVNPFNIQAINYNITRKFFTIHICLQPVSVELYISLRASYLLIWLLKLNNAQFLPVRSIT